MVRRTVGGMGAFEAVKQAKYLARRVAAEAYALTPGFLQAVRGKVVILMYHRVVGDEELSRQYIQPGMYVTTSIFEQHVNFLKKYFEVISLRDLLSMWEEQRWDPSRRYCVMTFDDGWLDNYTYALPVLREHAVPATIFLPTAFIGTDNWFWPEKVVWIYGQYAAREEGEKQRSLEALRRRHSWLGGLTSAVLGGDINALIENCKAFKPEQIDMFVSSWADTLEVSLPTERLVINWDEVREMSAAGISFGSHSVSHRILTKLEPREVVQEVEDSWAVLTQQHVNSVPVFCYPNGDWSAEIGSAVKAAGYRAATTTEFGYEGRTPTDPFGLKRVNVHNHITFTDNLFAFHLAGYNNIRMR